MGAASPMTRKEAIMTIQCENLSANRERCNCTYAGCDKKGNCCECLHYHLAMKQLPGCCFPDDVEKTYDRSFRKFIDVWSDRL
jgi:hypothetical protein